MLAKMPKIVRQVWSIAIGSRPSLHKISRASFIGRSVILMTIFQHIFIGDAQ